jgi:hypothetical protein
VALEDPLLDCAPLVVALVVWEEEDLEDLEDWEALAALVRQNFHYCAQNQNYIFNIVVTN